MIALRWTHRYACGGLVRSDLTVGCMPVNARCYVRCSCSDLWVLVCVWTTELSVTVTVSVFVGGAVVVCVSVCVPCLLRLRRRPARCACGSW